MYIDRLGAIGAVFWKSSRNSGRRRACEEVIEGIRTELWISRAPRMRQDRHNDCLVLDCARERSDRDVRKPRIVYIHRVLRRLGRS